MQDTITITYAVHDPTRVARVREEMEGHLDRLREVMEDSGIKVMISILPDTVLD